MKSLKTLLATVATAVLFVMPSQGASVTWDFTGTWSSTDYGPHGTAVAGSVTFDTDTSTATAFSFTVSGYSGGSVDYNMTGTGVVGVTNDSYDMLDFRVPVQMSGPSGLTGSLPWQTAQFTLFDNTGTALSSTAIPTTVPSLSSFLVKRVALIYGQGTFNDYYSFSTLTEATNSGGVPEPGSISLMALALGGAAFFLKRR